MSDIPPPLPKRNRTDNNKNNDSSTTLITSPYNLNSKLFNDNLVHETKKKTKDQLLRDRCYSLGRKPRNSIMVDNSLYSDLIIPPPPLPPRAPLSNIGSSESDAANSISKQMSYPLVATCATLVNNYVSNIVVTIKLLVFDYFFYLFLLLQVNFELCDGIRTIFCNYSV